MYLIYIYMYIYTHVYIHYIYVKLWLFHINVQQRPQHCKAIILQYKNKINNEAGTENQDEATPSRIPCLSRALWQRHCLPEAFKSNLIHTKKTCIWHLWWFSCKNPPATAGDTGDVGSIPGSERWRRKRQPTPAFLPGKSHEQRSLVGCSPWSHKESNTA